MLRWLLPVLAAGVVALVASGLLSANANPNSKPPTRSTGQLLGAVSKPEPAGFSGTVVAKAALGLPDLSSLGLAPGRSGLGLGAGGSGLAPGGSGLDPGGFGLGPLSLLSGTHAIRVWYGGATKQRIALLDSSGELDLFRNGTSLWQWNSATRTAVHRTLPSAAALSGPSELSGLSPDQAAQRILAMVQPFTTVTTERNAKVAGRSAYVLVLTPKQTGSLLRQVRIAVDGATMVPLAVQVYARTAGHPLLDVSFTRFSTGTPSEDNFDWTPPPGAIVRPPPARTDSMPGLAPNATVGTVGTGWTTVLKVTGLPSSASLAKQNPRAAALLSLLPAVKGAWGSGRLFRTTAFTALITDDGRAFAGAVEPSVLYAAAAK